MLYKNETKYKTKERGSRPLLGGLQKTFTPGRKSSHDPESEPEASKDTQAGYKEAHGLKDEVRSKYFPQHEVSA